MPTTLPPRQDVPPDAVPPDAPEPRDLEFRNVMCAAAMLLLAIGLVCEKFYPPTPGYSLAQTVDDIQLSP